MARAFICVPTFCEQDFADVRLPDRNAYNFFFYSQPKHICCGYSKESSQSDGSFEHPKLRLKLKD